MLPYSIAMLILVSSLMLVFADFSLTNKLGITKTNFISRWTKLTYHRFLGKNMLLKDIEIGFFDHCACSLQCQKRTPFVKIATHKHGMHRVDRSNLDGIIVWDEECLSSQIFK